MADLRSIFQNVRVHTGGTPHRGESPVSGGRRSRVSSLGRRMYDNHFMGTDPRQTECLSLGDTGVIVTQRDRTCRFSSGIPRGSWAIGSEAGQSKSIHLPMVDSAAIGPYDSFFVQFCDGHAKCCGLDSLTKALDRTQVSVECGGNRSGWYVMWEDGSSECFYLPRGLDNLLNGRPFPSKEVPFRCKYYGSAPTASGLCGSLMAAEISRLANAKHLKKCTSIKYLSRRRRTNDQQ